MRKILVALLLLMVICVPLVSATVIIDEYPYGASTSYEALSVVHPSGSGSFSAAGQSFQTRFNNTNVTSVSLWGFRTGGSCNTAYNVKIAGMAGSYGTTSYPNTTVYATSDTVYVSSFNTVADLVSFTFSTPYALMAGEYYTLYVYCSSFNATGYALFYFDGTAPVNHPGNYFKYSSSNWAADSTRDLTFIIYGDNGDPVTYLGGNTYITQQVTNTTVNADITTGDVNVGGVTAEFNNTAVTAGNVTAGNVTAGDVNLQMDNATLNVSGGIGGTGVDWMPTIFLLILLFLNIGLLALTKGYLLSSLVGLITITIVGLSFSDATITAGIMFSPWLQVLVLFVSISCMFINIIGSRDL